MTTADDIKTAIEQAEAGNWDAAHTLTQAHEGDATADWLHAVLHKIEGDLSNAAYWYTRCGKSAAAFADTTTELAAIRDSLG